MACAPVQSIFSSEVWSDVTYEVDCRRRFADVRVSPCRPRASRIYFVHNETRGSICGNDGALTGRRRARFALAGVRVARRIALAYWCRSIGVAGGGAGRSIFASGSFFPWIRVSYCSREPASGPSTSRHTRCAASGAARSMKAESVEEARGKNLRHDALSSHHEPPWVGSRAGVWSCCRRRGGARYRGRR